MGRGEGLKRAPKGFRMKWIIGIAAVMVITHLFFRRGIKKAERERGEERDRE